MRKHRVLLAPADGNGGLAVDLDDHRRPERCAAGAVEGRRQLGLGPCSGPSAQSASWLAGTTVTIEDLTIYLASLPLSRTYEVVDECRRRARVVLEEDRRPAARPGVRLARFPIGRSRTFNKADCLAQLDPRPRRREREMCRLWNDQQGSSDRGRPYRSQIMGRHERHLEPSGALCRVQPRQVKSRRDTLRRFALERLAPGSCSGAHYPLSPATRDARQLLP